MPRVLHAPSRLQATWHFRNTRRRPECRAGDELAGFMQTFGRAHIYKQPDGAAAIAKNILLFMWASLSQTCSHSKKSQT